MSIYIFTRISTTLLVLSAVGVTDAVGRMYVSGSLPIDISAPLRLVILLGAVLLTTGRKTLTVKQILPLTIFLVACTFSAGLGISPEQSLVAVATLLLLSATYAYSASATTTKSIIIAFRDAVSALALCSVVAYLAGAPWAAHPSYLGTNLLGMNAAVGLFGFKVVAGVASAVAIIALVDFPIRNKIANAIALTSCLSMIVLSDAVTAVIILLLSVPFGIFTRIKLDQLALGILALATTVIFVGGFVLLEPILLSAGRDGTFSGRTPIWTLALSLWQASPLTGWGYQSLLGTGGALIQGSVAGFAARWDSNHFHNDWLQLLADMGVVGLLAFIFLYLTSLEFARKRPTDKVTKRAALTIMVALTINSMVNGSFSALGLGYFFLVSFLFARRPEQNAEVDRSF